MGGAVRFFKIWLNNSKETAMRNVKTSMSVVTEITYRARAGVELIRMPKGREHGAV